MIFSAWHTRRLRARQKRKALQMLALSGVVRPSDVELRYPIPLIKISGTHTAPEAKAASNERMAPSLSQPFAQSPIQGTHRSQWVPYESPAAS
jgi:hypothetical protein